MAHPLGADTSGDSRSPRFHGIAFWVAAGAARVDRPSVFKIRIDTFTTFRVRYRYRYRYRLTRYNVITTVRYTSVTDIVTIPIVAHSFVRVIAYTLTLIPAVRLPIFVDQTNFHEPALRLRTRKRIKPEPADNDSFALCG